MPFAAPGQQRPHILPAPPRKAGPHPQPAHPSMHGMRPPPQPLSQFVAPRQVRASAASGPTKSVPATADLSKVAIAPSSQDYTCKERELGRDDDAVAVYGRKVRLVDGSSGSLYALCRSWVRNGLPQEPQPFFENRPKILPSPLPAFDTPVATDGDGDSANESSDNEHMVSVEDLTPKDLCKDISSVLKGFEIG